MKHLIQSSEYPNMLSEFLGTDYTLLSDEEVNKWVSPIVRHSVLGNPLMTEPSVSCMNNIVDNLIKDGIHSQVIPYKEVKVHLYCITDDHPDKLCILAARQTSDTHFRFRNQQTHDHKTDFWYESLPTKALLYIQLPQQGGFL